MPRVVPSALLAAWTALAATACTACTVAGTPAAAPAAAPSTAPPPALLTGRDVPPGFLPADDQHPFAGIRPDDPDCARLLRTADVSPERGAGRYAAFYRAEPGATLVQHVLRLPGEEAAARVERGREAIAGCPRLTLTLGDRWALMHRSVLRRPPSVPDAFAVRYGYGKGAGQIVLDVVMARSGHDLLVLAASGAIGAEGPHGIENLVATAIGRLAGGEGRPDRSGARTA